MGTLSQTLFHPLNPDTAYALTNFRGVWKTVDGGTTDWIECNNGLPATARRIVYGSVHPNLPNDLCILATGVGIFKSTDGGALWVAKNTGNPDSIRISCFERQPQNPNILYAATTNGFIYKSIDNAENWNCLNPGSPLPVTLRVIIFDPTNANYLYAGANGVNQFWKSTDAGVTWVLKNAGLVGFGGWIHGMDIDPTNPSTIYLNGYSNAIAKSTDRGENWFFSGTGIGQEINAICVDYTNTDIIYAAGIGWIGGSGAWKSTDKGETWNRINIGFPADRPYPSLNTMVMHPTDPSILYVGGNPMPGRPSIGVYKTTNGGNNWFETDSILRGIDVKMLAIDPVNPNTVFAATMAGLFKTTNGGTTWDTTTLIAPIARTIVFDPQNSNIIYAGMFGPASICKSTDAGATWDTISIANDDTTVICVAVAPSNPDVIYAGTVGNEQGVYVYKSLDGGLTWQRKSKGLPRLNDPDSMRWHRPKGVNSLAIDPINPNIVYAGIALEGGIYRTTDGGENWTAMNNGYNGYPFTDIVVIDPGDRKTLYAGSYNGIWTYTTTDTLEPSPQDKKAIVYPNPARGTHVTFIYDLDSAAEVTIKVYSLSKQLVASIAETKSAGENSTRLDISEIPSGIYLYSITIKDNASGKMENWQRQKLAIIR